MFSRRARSRSPHSRGSSDPPPAGVTVVRVMKKIMFIGGHLGRSKTCTSEKQLPENDGYDSDYSDEAWADLMKGTERPREGPPLLSPKRAPFGQSAQTAGKGLKGQDAREAGARSLGVRRQGVVRRWAHIRMSPAGACRASSACGAHPGVSGLRVSSFVREADARSQGAG